jgi:hypothetical protein
MSSPDIGLGRLPPGYTTELTILLVELQADLVALGVALRAHLAEQDRPLAKDPSLREAAAMAQKLTGKMSLDALTTVEATYAKLNTLTRRLGLALPALERTEVPNPQPAT